MPLPKFLTIGTDDAVAEFEAFAATHPSAAADVLARLTHIRSHGLHAIHNSHVIVGTTRFRCIQTAGWAIFYVADGVFWKRKGDPAPDVCVVMVEQMTRAFTQICADAQARVGAAGL